jgi:hypothetical protein
LVPNNLFPLQSSRSPHPRVSDSDGKQRERRWGYRVPHQPNPLRAPEEPIKEGVIPEFLMMEGVSSKQQPHAATELMHSTTPQHIFAEVSDSQTESEKKENETSPKMMELEEGWDNFLSMQDSRAEKVCQSQIRPHRQAIRGIWGPLSGQEKETWILVGPVYKKLR